MLKGEPVASSSLNGVGEERELLSDQIRNALSDEIASGHLRAGTALDEQHLADRFGASRTPVREALRQLAAGGLVEVRPRRGVIVSPMTPERIMDMFETTAEIEALCVRLATHRMTPLEFSHLLELHESSKPAFPRYLSLALTVSVNSAKIIRTIWAMTGASNGSDVG